MNYNVFDRSLHRLAFATTAIQWELEQFETQLFRNQLKAIQNENQVHLCGLPRTGSTTLLHLLMNSREFSTHNYRNMPFVLTPLLWNKLSRPFMKKNQAKLRAHNDGITINNDSDEALEEVLWKNHWPNYYQSNYIVPWEKAKDPEFATRLSQQQKKIILLGHGPRYLAKKRKLFLLTLKKFTNT